MSVDVGSIEATLEVDRDPFQAGLDAAQSSAEEFIAEPYTATLSLDTTEAQAEIDKLRAELESLNTTVFISASGEDPAAATAGLEDLGAGAETLDAQLAGLATQADTTAVSVADLSGTAALTGDDMATLAESIAPVTAGLEGFVAQAEAAGPYGGLGAISAGAEAAGVDLETFLGRLEAANISFEDFEQAAAMVGVSTRDFAAGIGAASNELQGADLAGFLRATGQDAVDYQLYMEGAGNATGDLAAAAGPLTDDVERLGGTLQGIQPSTSSFTVWASEAADRLVAMGLAQRNAGGDLLDFNGNLTTTGSLLKNFGVVLDDGRISSVGFDQALSQFAAGGLTDATGGMEAFLSSQEGVVASQQAVSEATAALEKGFAAATQADTLFTAGMVDMDAAAVGASGGVLDVSNSLAALGSGGGGGGGGGASTLDQLGMAFLGAGKDASTLWEAVAAGSPIIASTVTVGVGAFLGLSSAALTAASAVGVFGIAAIGDLSGIESAVENAYTQWFEMNDVIAAISPAVQALGGTVTAMLDAITPLVQPAVAAFMEMENAIQKVTVSPAFQQFVQFLGSEMGPMLSSIVGTLGTFGQAFGKMAEVAQPFTTMMADGMQSLADDLLKFASSNGFQEFIDWLVQNGPKVGQTISNIVGIIESLWEGFTKVGGAVLPFVEDLTELIDKFVELGPVPEIIAGIVASIGALGLVATPILALGGAFGLLTGAGVAAGVGMVAAGATIGVATLGVAAVGAVAAVEIKDHWSGIQTAAGDVANWFSDSMPHFFMSGYNTVADAASDFTGYLGKGWDDIEGGATDVGNWFGSSLPHAFESGWNLISSGASSFGSDFVSFFESLPNKLLSIGEDIIEGLWNGLKRGWDDVFGWLEDIAKDIEGVFKDVLGIFSPSTVMFAVGDNAMAGLGGGLQTGWESHVAGFLTSSAAQIASAFATEATAAPSAGAVSVASLAGGLVTAPTGSNLVGAAPINYTSTLIVNAPASTAADIAAVVKPLIKQSHAELVTKIYAGSRGH